MRLVDKVPVSDLCDERGLNPSVFYNWQKQFFENGHAAFAQHILPSGFQDVRYYSRMSPNCKLQLAKVRWLVCGRCGGPAERLTVTEAAGYPIWQQPLSARGPPCAA